MNFIELVEQILIEMGRGYTHIPPKSINTWKQIKHVCDKLGCKYSEVTDGGTPSPLLEPDPIDVDIAIARERSQGGDLVAQLTQGGKKKTDIYQKKDHLHGRLGPTNCYNYLVDIYGSEACSRAYAGERYVRPEMPADVQSEVKPNFALMTPEELKAYNRQARRGSR